MDLQVSGQAPVLAGGDVPTSATEGHEVSFIPSVEQAPKPTPTEEQKAASTVSNQEAQNWRKSDKEWQEMVEKTKSFESFKTQLAESLGVKPEQVETETDLVTKLQQQMAQLKEENARTRWEAAHPIVNSEDYKDEWEKILKQKGHLVQRGDLSYDDLWKLTRTDTPSKTPALLREQELAVGSIPAASKTPVSTGDIDADVLTWMQQRHPNLTVEQIRALK